DEPAAAATPRAGAAKSADRKPADAATRARVQNQLKQILLAIHNYHAAYNRFPGDITDKDGKPLLSWRVALLPFMEQEQLYKAFAFDEPWDSAHNKKLLGSLPKVYQLPGQAAGGTKTVFQGLAGPGTLFERRKKITLASVTDGTSNTLAVLAAGEPVEWTKPADIPFDPENPKVPASPYPNVLIVGIADGSVKAIGPKLDAELFRRLAVRDDGEVIDHDQIPRAEARAVTDEDRALAKELAAKNRELKAEIDRLAAESFRLAAERQARRAVDLDALMAENRHLMESVERLRAEIEQLRAEAGDKPASRPTGKK
ncbi:MAG: DUF1559 domain-containing protein, partial [Gemmataceae bacterium]|nr:DUF1559 domain-containing protein [Gemmataceae bacterium]